jgi:hypothetical protein
MNLTTARQASVDGVMQGCGGSGEDLRGGFERGRWAVAASLRCHCPTIFITALAAVLLGVATAEGYLQRTVNGPPSVVPGHAYLFGVSGFIPGEEVYATVQPVSCARTSDRCEQAPCPSCASTRIGPSGTATVRFRWPESSLYVVANMDIAHHRWRRRSQALVRIDLASRIVPRGCQRMPSITANPQAGSIVCAATLTQIG